VVVSQLTESQNNGGCVSGVAGSSMGCVGGSYANGNSFANGDALSDPYSESRVQDQAWNDCNAIGPTKFPRLWPHAEVLNGG
jgi:hypothetical protein